MRFEFERVVREVDLGEYVPEMEGNKIPVWVNVPRDLLQRMMGVKKDMPNEEFFGILHELWHNPHPTPLQAPLQGREAQGDGTEQDGWPMEDIRALHAHCMENDYQLWVWLTGRTFKLVYDYRLGQKKE